MVAIVSAPIATRSPICCPHGWLPTLRIADFEVKDWIYGRDASARMGASLAERL
jgi:hypothetical protein